MEYESTMDTSAISWAGRYLWLTSVETSCLNSISSLLRQTTIVSYMKIVLSVV